MINVHILDLADPSACYNGTIKHIFELTEALWEKSLLHVNILLDGFDAHFQSFMSQYLGLLKLHALHNEKRFGADLIVSCYDNGTPEGWTIGKYTIHGIQVTHQTFQSMLMSSREYLQVFIVPWRTVTGEAFQKIATRMYEENIHADIIVPVTKSSTLVTMNPAVYPIVYDYKYNSIWKPFKEEDYAHRKLAGDPYHIEKIINSDMLKHYIRPKVIQGTDELRYLFTALYAEPMVDYEPCDSEEALSRMRKEGVTE